MIFNGILELIGKTPILKLNQFVKDENIADVYVKLEKFNPGSSVKDRAALGMIEAAEKVKARFSNSCTNKRKYRNRSCFYRKIKRIQSYNRNARNNE